MQSPAQIKTRLFSLVNKGIKYDLGRMFKAASLLGDPQKAYPSVHVAGTNGKGSTCAYIESVLRRAGYRTGLYTSPHIVNFEERFKINGLDIGEADWFDVYREQEEVISGLGLTFFEAATLMSFEIFKRAGADYAVFETGMGGRLDATNIITPAVSVITKIALDHQEYLGDDIVTIAAEKLGIVKPGVPVVMLDPVNSPPPPSCAGGLPRPLTGVSDDAHRIRQLASDRCAAVNSRITFVNPEDAKNILYQNSGISFESLSKRYDISLQGRHQIQNALLALAAVNTIRELPQSGNYNSEASISNSPRVIDDTVIYEGLRSAALPGRFQVAVIKGREVVFDVAHNPDAARVLVEALDTVFPGRRVLFVVGMMKDKDIPSTISILSSRAASFHFAQPNTPRAADPKILKDLTKCKFDGTVITYESIQSALSAALTGAVDDDIVCVTGSFFTIGEVMI